MTRKILLTSTLILTLLTVSGCAISFGGTKTGAHDGGIFKSTDAGTKWAPKGVIATTNFAPASINTANVTKVVFDPEDNLAVYLATSGSGLVFTYDGGESWQTPRNQPTEMAIVNDVAVDAKASCTIYAAAANEVFKSTNCSRTWSKIFFNTITTDITLSRAVDWYNPAIVYAGTSQGNLLQSTDAGHSWTNIKMTKNAIKKIIVDPYDSRTIYVATVTAGIFKTTDQGANWQQINNEIRSFSRALEYRDLVYSASKKDTLYLASVFGIIKSTDGGTIWEKLPLITPEGGANILSLAVDPKNDSNIYYATDSTFYKSVDGGKNWTTQKLSTTRGAADLEVDPVNTSVIFMAAAKLQK